MSSERTPPGRRADFPHFLALQTRWADNDYYGHVNNVVYYSYFDTLINRFLVDEGGFDWVTAEALAIAVETMCRFRKSFSYPETIDAGLRVAKLGTSSVRYESGLFGPDEDEARAEGHFVHVFVDRASNRPVPIPARMRAAFERILKQG